MIAPDDIALIIHDPDAICISIITNSYICPDSSSPDRSDLLNFQGWLDREMVWKSAVDLAVEFFHLTTQIPEKRPGHDPCSSIPCIDHNLHLLFKLDVLLNIILIRPDDLNFGKISFAGDEFSLFDQSPQILYLFSKDGAFSHRDFESIKLRWIVTSSDHHPAIFIQMENGEIVDRRWTDADIDDIASG